MTTYFIVVIFFVVFDRLFKGLAMKDVFNEPIQLVSNILSFNFSANYNIAFSLPLAGPILEIIIIFIILFLIYNLIVLLKKHNLAEAGLMFIIILGAMSNFLDRFKYGYVIDYLDLKYFTVFNLADVMIVGGLVGLVWQLIKKKKQLV